MNGVDKNDIFTAIIVLASMASFSIGESVAKRKEYKKYAKKMAEAKNFAIGKKKEEKER